MAIPKLLLLIFPAANGAAMTVILYLLDVAFWKSMAVALVSAIISGVFLLLSTILLTRETRQNRQAIHEVRDEQRDVKAKLGADQRRHDNP